eukprot:2230593-Ditylum_brightwellii.AAC.1
MTPSSFPPPPSNSSLFRQSLIPDDVSVSSSKSFLKEYPPPPSNSSRTFAQTPRTPANGLHMFGQLEGDEEEEDFREYPPPPSNSS